ncbi:nucleotidyltransferase family protein [Salinisphaera sp. T31B1]|uniref:nucleotidyltransferase family protein n=1 Tax=Salinisphaera sp. T31B1 TaxID=727963 RepID=UPI00333FAFEC
MIGAVVLAAGSNRRFGYGSKPLARLGRLTLLEHVLTALSGAPVRPVVVVTGRRAAWIRRTVNACQPRLQSVRLVDNRLHAHGMAGSLRRGLAALPPYCDAAFVCLADMPTIDTQLVRRLCRHWRPGIDYVRPAYAGRVGHPVLISRSLFGPVTALSGDRGAQSILDRVPSARKQLVTASRSSVLDVDTPEALRRLRRTSDSRLRGHSRLQ